MFGKKRRMRKIDYVISQNKEIVNKLDLILSLLGKEKKAKNQKPNKLGEIKID